MAGALIGALRVSLSAETSAFEAGMKRSQRTAATTANSIQSSFKGIGNSLKAGIAGFLSGISIGTIVAATKAALEYAGSLGETAQQLGVTTKELQIFRYAVAQNGGTVENADQALGKFALSISKARSGSEQAAKAFDAVGVKLTDLNTLSKTEILGKVADGMKATGGASANAAAGVAIFGKGFQKIVPVLDLGSEGFNKVAAAAEKLGIVLDDKLINQADEAADKVDALQTVLKAQIAGAVAQNAGAIVDLANSLVYLVSKIAAAIKAWNDFQNALNAQAFDLASKNPFLSSADQKKAAQNAARARGKISDSGIAWNVGGSSVTTTLGQGGSADAEARRRGLKLMSDVPVASGTPKQFLAGGGGGSKRKGRADHSAERALSDANQFDQEIRRAQIDVLNATKDLATDAVDRYAISIKIKDAEDAAYQAELLYQTQLYKLTDGQQGLSETQAAQLQAQHDILSDLERKKLIADEQQRAFEESAKLDDLNLSLERERLQSEAQLADTAKEQRDVQLKLLDLAYRQERARLQTILADEQASEAAKEDARRRLANLNRTFGNDRQGVINGTRGPLEDLKSQLPLDPDQLNEALENVAANGLKSLEDGLLDIVTGTKSVKEAFHQMAAALLADLLRIAIQKYVIGTILNLVGGAGAGAGGGGGGGGFFGLASGGFVSGPGGPKSDSIPAMLSNGEFVINAKSTRQFLPLLKHINDGDIGRFAMGGLAVPRASYGSRAGVSNDNAAGVQPVQHNHFDLRGAVMTEDLLRQMNAMSEEAADKGASMGVRRVIDLNERTFGKALGKR